MKMKKRTLVIALLMLSATMSFAQQHFGQEFDLSEALPVDDSHEYVATDYISLQPGFSFSAASQQSAHFRISGTGIDESQDLILTAYPNPAKGEIHIPVNVMTPDISRIQIFDVIGRKCLDCSISKNGELISIDTKNFEAGMYIFQVVMDDTILTKGRFIKENNNN